MRRVLVTGGAGFVGSNFVHYWRREHPDDRLVVLDALTYAGNLHNLSDIGGAGFFLAKGDRACGDPLQPRQVQESPQVACMAMLFIEE